MPGSDDHGHSTLSDFVKLNEGLPRAICNEQATLRAPSFDGLKRDLSHLPVFYTLLAPKKWSESHAIEFLFGASGSGPRVDRLSAVQEGQLEEARKRLSRDLCIAELSVKGTKDLTTARPRALFELMPYYDPLKYWHSTPRAEAEPARLWIQDRNERAGYLSNQWWLGGWVEPTEVMMVQSGGRRYRRLTNPVTDVTQMVEVSDLQDWPLAELIPSVQSRDVDYNTDHRERKLLLYHLRMEQVAFAEIQANPKHDALIRKILDFYRAQMESYTQLPKDNAFRVYEKSSGSVPSRKQSLSLLGPAFSKVLSSAHVGNAHVIVQWLEPEPRLHGIWMEYQRRLKGLHPPHQ